MNIVFFGTSDFGLPALEALRSRHSVVAVVSTPDKPSGRKLQMAASPVKRWAQSNGIPAFDYPREDALPLLATLRASHPDIFIVISFGALLKSEFLAATRHGSLNVHASLLPKYRGASPMQSAILSGDAVTGVSVMRMIERLDAGDVLFQKKTAIGADEDIFILKETLAALAAEAVLEAIDQLEHGTAKFTVQDERASSYAKKIKKEDGRIDWTNDAKALHGRVRAFLGWPGSFFFYGGKRIVVLKAQLVADKTTAKPGAVLDVSEASGLRVAAGGGSVLRIVELQREGKKQLSWVEFRKGCAVKTGESFE